MQSLKSMSKLEKCNCYWKWCKIPVTILINPEFPRLQNYKHFKIHWFLPEITKALEASLTQHWPTPVAGGTHLEKQYSKGLFWENLLSSGNSTIKVRFTPNILVVFHKAIWIQVETEITPFTARWPLVPMWTSIARRRTKHSCIWLAWVLKIPQDVCHFHHWLWADLCHPKAHMLKS